MTVSSMTGFARASGRDDRFSWTWEVRSVNARGLDVRCRVPGGFEAVDQAARAECARRFERGNVSLSLNVERIESGPSPYRVNRPLLDQVLALRDDLSGRIADAPPTLEGLLAIRGMLEPVEEEEDGEAQVAREAAVIATAREAIAALAEMRRGEGEQLAGVLSGHLDELAELTRAAGETAAVQPDAIQARLRALIDELLGADRPLPEERLAQEAAILVGKADIREELDRLRMHVESAREMLAAGGAVGRRLDFLCQELNREANTLCSKSADIELTRIGLAMKAGIERLREQVQNAE